MKAGLLALHRYVGLAVAALWIVQALTGALLVFRWELDDGVFAGPAPRADFVAIERRGRVLEAQHPGSRVTSIWSSATASGRYDLVVENAATGAADSWRVDGAGEVVRRAWGDRPLGPGTFFDTLTTLHQTLFAGAAGRWIVGASGLLLASNLAAGLALAAPRPGRWRAALLPRAGGPPHAVFHAWHRAAGLWLVAPALALVVCGAALSFEEPLRAATGAEVPGPTAADAAGGRPLLGPAEGVRRALARHPGAQVSGVVFPTADQPWYRIRLLQPGEPRQAFGRTSVCVDARSGVILSDYDPLKARLAPRVFDLLYPLHTGQIFGPAGRMAAGLVALWLVAMTGLGVALWAARRRARRRAPDGRFS